LAKTFFLPKDLIFLNESVACRKRFFFEIDYIISISIPSSFHGSAFELELSEETETLKLKIEIARSG
jgi:hypothetical protein